MLEKNLEECLNNAFKFAHENYHEFVTTEHLLLCILNNLPYVFNIGFYNGKNKR